MLKLKTITILICATSVLTLSVTNTKTDGSTKETLVDPIERHRDSESVYSTLNPITKSARDNLSKDSHGGTVTPRVSGQIHNSETTNPLIIAPKTVSESTVVAEGIELTSKELLPANAKSKVAKIRNASVVARKGVISASKISARKGVGLESPISMESSIEGFDEAIHSAVTNVNLPNKTEQMTKNIDKKIKYAKKNLTEENSGPVHINLPVAMLSTANYSTIKISYETTNTESAKSVSVSSISDVSSATPPSPSTKRFKPKPTVTIGEMDIDKPIPASPTKTPPLGMPRKIDYIVPVIITIMALPLLGGAAFLLYRRGRDCWDKRHYRRMDFLIDGMYNDYSWK